MGPVKTKRITDLGQMNVLAYGLPKVGKTTLASQIPNAIFFATEEGHHFVEVDLFRINAWEDIFEAGKWLQNNKHEYKTIVVDIVDWLYKYCEAYVMKKHKVDHPSDLPYGKGFSLVKDEFSSVINKLNKMGYGMFFISHAKEKTLKKKSGEWTQMGTTLGASPETVISGMSDLILYCYIDKNGNRVMRTKPNEYIIAGDRSGKLPEVMPMDYEMLVEKLRGK